MIKFRWHQWNQCVSGRAAVKTLKAAFAVGTVICSCENRFLTVVVIMSCCRTDTSCVKLPPSEPQRRKSDTQVCTDVMREQSFLDELPFKGTVEFQGQEAAGVLRSISAFRDDDERLWKSAARIVFPIICERHPWFWLALKPNPQLLFLF